jgi:hypothetical protein
MGPWGPSAGTCGAALGRIGAAGTWRGPGGTGGPWGQGVGRTQEASHWSTTGQHQWSGSHKKPRAAAAKRPKEAAATPRPLSVSLVRYICRYPCVLLPPRSSSMTSRLRGPGRLGLRCVWTDSWR